MSYKILVARFSNDELHMKANFGVSESAVVTAGSDRARGKGATTFTY